MERLYKVDSAKRLNLLEELRTELMREPAVVFVYVYGSFLGSEGFHDVDVGAYLATEDPEKFTATALALAQRLTARSGFPVDVRILNQAPTSFVFHVLRGQLIFSRNEDCLTEVIETTIRRYLDIAPLLRQSAKEAFAA
jgi:uncharacterized protein